MIFTGLIDIDYVEIEINMNEFIIKCWLEEIWIWLLIVDDNDQRAWSNPVKEHVLGDVPLWLGCPDNLHNHFLLVKEHVLGDGALLWKSQSGGAYCTRFRRSKGARPISIGWHPGGRAIRSEMCTWEAARRWTMRQHCRRPGRWRGRPWESGHNHITFLFNWIMNRYFNF